MMNSRLLWKAWQISAVLLFLGALAMYLAIQISLASTLPKQPDLVAKRVVPLQAKGGLIYANESEKRLWDASLCALWVAGGVFFLTGIARHFTKESERDRGRV